MAKRRTMPHLQRHERPAPPRRAHLKTTTMGRSAPMSPCRRARDSAQTASAVSRRFHAQTVPRPDGSAPRRFRAQTVPRPDASAPKRFRAQTVPRPDASAPRRFRAETVPRPDGSAPRRFRAQTVPRPDGSAPRRFRAETVSRPTCDANQRRSVHSRPGRPPEGRLDSHRRLRARAHTRTRTQTAINTRQRCQHWARGCALALGVSPLPSRTAHASYGRRVTR